MFSYKYYLDTTLYDGADFPIKDIEDFEEVLERDYDKRGILVKYPTRISFVGDAHDYIKTVRDSDTFCGEINFKLLIGRENGNFEEYQVGVIYISTAIFNLNECYVDCEVVDNSYFARILNNYKCEAMLASNLSKNGETITPCAYIEFKPFDPSTGGNLADSRYGVDVYDALKFLVQFMTDGTITFQSDWFEATTPGTEWKSGIGNNGLLIVNGEALRDTTGSSNKAEIWITFEKLFRDIAKIVNLWFYIRKNADGSLTMKAERYPDFQNELVLASFRYTQELELSFDNTNLYATVDVGSNRNNTNLSGADYIGYIPTLTFRTETYNVAGQCNNGSSLDLKTDLITDHNLIVYQTLQADDDNNYDEGIYLIQYDNSMANPHDCNKYNTFNAAPVSYYNRYLMNDWVLEMTDFHGELIKNNTPGDVSFDVYNILSSYTYDDNFPMPNPLVFTVPFNAEYSDPGNDFDTTTFKWTCPADGFYQFEFKFVLQMGTFKSYSNAAHTQSPTGMIHDYLIICTPNIADSFIIYSGAMFENTWEFTNTISGFYTSGDIEWLDVSITDLSVFPDFYVTSFNVINSQLIMNYSINGGILKPNDRDNILINKFVFKSNIEQDEWQTIRQNASKGFNLFITPDNVTTAWAKSIKRKVLTGNTEVELLTNNLNY